MGGARTALFNWIFAKHHGGVFILRIEDTDKERSKPEFERGIFEDLAWLGLSWDEGFDPKSGNDQGSYGPYTQSKRTGLYANYLKRLLSEGRAYYCFCTKEELEGGRASQLAQGLAPRYSGRCRELSQDAVHQRLKKGESAVIRFKTPDMSISFTDVIRGHISFDMGLLGDFPIARTIQEPLYNFVAVIDDFEMKISHVIRGEEHLANTPKQMLIQQALNFPHPQYAHLPLILNSDRSKMSKRFTDTAVKEYRDAGYLPEAIVNFLMLLGWHPPGNRELFSLDELVQQFDLARVQKGGAIFNVEKFEWLNAQYLKRMSAEELLAAVRAAGAAPASISPDAAARAVALVRDRMKKLSDFGGLTAFLFELPAYSPELLRWKERSFSDTAAALQAAAAALSPIPENAFRKQETEMAFEPLITAQGRGEVLWPVRVALSGMGASPGPHEIMEALGKTESLRRITAAMEKLIGTR